MKKILSQLMLSAAAVTIISTGVFIEHAQAALDEIIVSAERRVGDLQTVPVAVTAFNRVELERRQITSTIDLIQNIPNLAGSHNVSLGGSNSYFMRGIGNAESIATFDVPIGTYVDEVYISRQNANQVELFEVENLEVLRGPQGILFGRNTTGGAIVITSQKPQDEFGASIEGSYGSYERWTVKGSVNVPVTEGFAAKLSAFKIEDEGWMDSLTTGDTYNGEDSWGVRGAIKVEPNDSIRWDAAVQYLDTRAQALGTAAVPGVGQPLSGDLQKNYTGLRNCRGSSDVVDAAIDDRCTFNSMESLLVTSNLAWDVGPVTVNFITGWYDLEHKFVADFLENSPALPFGGFFGDTFIIANNGSHEQFSQEIKVTGEFGDGLVKFVGGLFYMDEENETEFTDIIGCKTATAADGCINPFPFILADRQPLENGTESKAVYANVDFAITDKLTLLAGARWTEEDKKFSLNGSLFNGGVPFTNTELLAVGIPLKQTTERVTPRFGLKYQINDDVMAFFTYTEGFKSGGWNARGTSPVELQPFGPEDATSYELGIRSEWWDNRIRLNATAFLVQYDDVQIATVFPGSTQFVTTNAGDTEVKGIELEGAINPLEGLNIYGAFGYQDGEYERLSAFAVAAAIGPKPVRTPEYTASLGFDYTLPIDIPGDITIGGQVRYTDDYFMGNSNTPETFIDDTTLFNAQIGYTSEDERWTAVLECKNCGDEEWFNTNLFQTLYTSEPIRWNFRVGFRY